MRPADEIGRLLAGLEDHTSAAFDQRTLRDMFSALEASPGGIPAPSRPDRDGAIFRSRITKLALAAMLVLAPVLLGLLEDPLLRPEL